MSMGKKIALCTVAGIAICAGMVAVVAYGIQRGDDQKSNLKAQSPQAKTSTTLQRPGQPGNPNGGLTTKAEKPKDRIRELIKEKRVERQAKRAKTESKAINLKGDGRQASDKFMLEPGLCIMEMTHDGQSNLIVRLLDENGDEVDTLINKTGPFVGEYGFAVDRDGEYLLDVDADGAWTATLRQPRPTDAESTPQTLKGAGYQATPFFKLGRGLAIFKMNHQGPDRFKVELLDRDGKVVGQLVNVLGPFTESKTIAIEEDDIYFLNVGASGEWTIDVQ